MGELTHDNEEKHSIVLRKNAIDNLRRTEQIFLALLHNDDTLYEYINKSNLPIVIPITIVGKSFDMRFDYRICIYITQLQMLANGLHDVIEPEIKRQRDKFLVKAWTETGSLRLNIDLTEIVKYVLENFTMDNARLFCIIFFCASLGWNMYKNLKQKDKEIEMNSQIITESFKIFNKIVDKIPSGEMSEALRDPFHPLRTFLRMFDEHIVMRIGLNKPTSVKDALEKTPDPLNKKID